MTDNCFFLNRQEGSGVDQTERTSKLSAILTSVAKALFEEEENGSLPIISQYTGISI